jgi:Zn-dependent membrane protease YugP
MIKNPHAIAAALALALLVALGPAACPSKHEPGVSSSYRSQWTTVAADTQATTEAARTVLESEGLKEVKATATNLDGTASAKKADGTPINVTVRKKGDKYSEVSATVGTVGDPEVGAEIVRKIKQRAEGK